MKVLTEDGAAFEFDLENKRVRSVESYGEARREIPHIWLKYSAITIPMKGFRMEVHCDPGPNFFLSSVREIFEVTPNDESFLQRFVQDLVGSHYGC